MRLHAVTTNIRNKTINEIYSKKSIQVQLSLVYTVRQTYLIEKQKKRCCTSHVATLQNYHVNASNMVAVFRDRFLNFKFYLYVDIE